MSRFSDAQNGVEKGIKLANSIIQKLIDEFNIDNGNLIDAQAEILTAVVKQTNCEYSDIAKYIQEITPITLLTRSTLFTGSGLTMHSELQKEILSSDEVCLLISFIKTSGLNLLMPQLKKITDKGHLLRVIATTYTKATDFKAIKRLASLKNTEIKISYNTERERLHAKAYLFLRNTGFHTAVYWLF